MLSFDPPAISSPHHEVVIPRHGQPPIDTRDTLKYKCISPLAYYGHINTALRGSWKRLSWGDSGVFNLSISIAPGAARRDSEETRRDVASNRVKRGALRMARTWK